MNQPITSINQNPPMRTARSPIHLSDARKAFTHKDSWTKLIETNHVQIPHHNLTNTWRTKLKARHTKTQIRRTKSQHTVNIYIYIYKQHSTCKNFLFNHHYCKRTPGTWRLLPLHRPMGEGTMNNPFERHCMHVFFGFWFKLVTNI